MMALEYDDDIVVIDCGLLFPEDDMPGVDLGIPDITYLVENWDKVRAILITHGHEDHIGGLPFVLPELNVPVYASQFAHGLISAKLRERGLLRDSRLNVVEPHSPFTLGCFLIEFFRVSHSIPDSFGIAVTTPIGTVIHTGDFKIDHTPALGPPMDLATIARLAGDDGALLLCSDSTYADLRGFTESEQVVGDALEQIIADAPGRVIVATFASLISRVQQVIDAAVRHNRKVTVVGRSMSNNVKMATNMGYLDAPPDTLVSLNEARRLPNDRVIIMATGSQGEPTSALVRIANGAHRDIAVEPGDTVVISATPIPGNELTVAKTIDNLFRQGANVIYSRTATVHVHGHASQEELKTMLSIVNPRFFMPVQGEYRHLMAHAAIARSMGIRDESIFVLDDGDVLALTSDEGVVVDKVVAGSVFVDGRTFWDMDSSVFAERRRLARDGVVVVSATISASTGEVLTDPEVAAYGYVELNERLELFQKTSKVALTLLEDMGASALTLEKARNRVRDSISKFLHKETGRRPTVLTIIDYI